MTHILALETATPVLSVALARENTILGEVMLNTGLTHSRTLFPAMESLLKNLQLRYQDLGVLAVSAGPGSFTGLRIGITAANTLAYALNTPVLGVSTLKALAHNLAGVNGFIAPLLKAGRGEVFTALYQPDAQGNLVELAEPRSIAPREWFNKLPRPVHLLGEGTVIHAREIQESLGDQAVLYPPSFNFPRAAQIAHLAWNSLINHPDLPANRPVQPYYLRPPDIRQPKPI